MELNDVLSVMPVTQSVIVIDGHKKIARGDISQVALELPNCVLEKSVKTIRAHSKSIIVVCLEDES